MAKTEPCCYFMELLTEIFFMSLLFRAAFGGAGGFHIQLGGGFIVLYGVQLRQTMDNGRGETDIR